MSEFHHIPAHPLSELEMKKMIVGLQSENAALRELVARMAAEMREVDHEFCSLVDYDDLQNKI